MNKPLKKLAIFVYSLGGGGAEKAALELVAGLQNHFDIKLVLFSDVVKYELPSGLTYTVLDQFDFYDNPIKKLLKLPILAYKYALFCKENHIDISLSLLARPNIISSLSKFFANPARIVLSEHSTLSHYYGGGFVQNVLKSIIRHLYPRADKIIAVSDGVRGDLIANFGVDMSRAQILYNPIDIDAITTKSLEPIGLELQGFTFVTCGRLIESKNTELLIRAFARLGEPNTNLVILGEGECRGELESLAGSLGVASRVYFVGFTQNPYAYLAKSSCFVFGSRLEALPTVLIEALVCGLPVISTDCPSGPDEILCGEDVEFANGIKKAKYGLLVELDNEVAFCGAMSMLYEDEVLRHRYADMSITRAHDFEKSKIFNMYKDALMGVTD